MTDDIFREKWYLHNKRIAAHAWLILLKFATSLAFIVSRMKFYAPASEFFFSRNQICTLLMRAIISREKFCISLRNFACGISPLDYTQILLPLCLRLHYSCKPGNKVGASRRSVHDGYKNKTRLNSNNVWIFVRDTIPSLRFSFKGFFSFFLLSRTC